MPLRQPQTFPRRRIDHDRLLAGLAVVCFIGAIPFFASRPGVAGTLLIVGVLLTVARSLFPQPDQFTRIAREILSLSARTAAEVAHARIIIARTVWTFHGLDASNQSPETEAWKRRHCDAEADAILKALADNQLQIVSLSRIDSSARKETP